LNLKVVGLTCLNGRLLDSVSVHHQASFIGLAITLQTAPPCARVNQVIVPSVAEEYEMIADHAPHVAPLKPGVLQNLHEGGGEV